ncbi:hypothetical protein PAESOLCIP111_05879 [Paenibacillus solanacearum]|uniref:PDZ domain-containing protein n=1 Tax=Paenibacillus solanacearum TaxID=2048548 RepID=A0A916NLN5_9BACL|nr:S41 family peptidase [Paenibacillus solanacearum]CAG7649498.1 hypothetical protein PAESOLCIP111_05879 [Paenibacillus solanacearum]
MSPKKLRSTRFWKTTAAGLLSMTLLIPAASPVWAAEASSTVTADQLKEVYDLLEKNHVSAPSSSKLAETGIKAMVGSLQDPYTQYFSPEELRSFENSVENQYVGIGVRVGEEPDAVYVAEVFDGSPAKEAGIQVGDKFIEVEGVSVAGKKVNDVTEKILGEEGTVVTIRVLRGEETKELKVKRQKIQLPTVVRKLFDPGIGYIQIASFSSDSDEKLAQELNVLKGQGIKSLVVDLRDNPGGLLDSALNMVKLFVKEGVLIHTSDRNNVDDPVSFKDGTTQPFPVYFLVNEYSASASEVLTGALQDYGVVKAIGTKTYGKGSVQTLFPLKSGGALKVTIEEYLTPKLRKVNKVGLEPDRKVEGDLAQLVTALRMAGSESFELTYDRKALALNGVSIVEPFDVIRQDGKVFVPARSIAALAGAEVTWNDATSSLEIASEQGKAAYGADASDYLNQNGTGFVTLDSIASAFANVKWEDNGSKLTVSVNKP